MQLMVKYTQVVYKMSGAQQKSALEKQSMQLMMEYNHRRLEEDMQKLNFDLERQQRARWGPARCRLRFRARPHHLVPHRILPTTAHDPVATQTHPQGGESNDAWTFMGKRQGAGVRTGAGIGYRPR